MYTDYDDEATALSLLDFTAPTDLSQASDCTDAPAWSSSPLGDPAMDDEEFFELTDRHRVSDWGREPWSLRTGAAVGVTLLGTLAVGAVLGIAILDFTDSPAPAPTVVVPNAATAPATPQVAPAPATPAPAPVQSVAPVAATTTIPVAAPRAARPSSTGWSPLPLSARPPPIRFR